MRQTIQLPIEGYRGIPVANTFIRQDTETDHLGIIFPGRAYSCAMPLLYYSTGVMLTAGADLLQVEYGYDRPEVGHMPPEERAEMFAADVLAACEAGMTQRKYSRISLIGKSLGTLAMGHLLDSITGLENARCVWLTPLLHNDRLGSQIITHHPPSLFVIGTADEEYNTSRLAEMCEATGGESVVIDNANHGLVVEGDVSQTIAALQQVMESVERFVRGAA